MILQYFDLPIRATKFLVLKLEEIQKVNEIYTEDSLLFCLKTGENK